MQQSEIREIALRQHPAPDYAALHPGYACLPPHRDAVGIIAHGHGRDDHIARGVNHRNGAANIDVGCRIPGYGGRTHLRARGEYVARRIESTDGIAIPRIRREWCIDK